MVVVHLDCVVNVIVAAEPSNCVYMVGWCNIPIAISVEFKS